MTMSRGLRAGTPRTPREVFEAQNEQLKELWSRGWHTQAIAAAIGISVPAVVQRRKALGLEPRTGTQRAPPIILGPETP